MCCKKWKDILKFVGDDYDHFFELKKKIENQKKQDKFTSNTVTDKISFKNWLIPK